MKEHNYHTPPEIYALISTALSKIQPNGDILFIEPDGTEYLSEQRPPKNLTEQPTDIWFEDMRGLARCILRAYGQQLENTLSEWQLAALAQLLSAYRHNMPYIMAAVSLIQEDDEIPNMLHVQRAPGSKSVAADKLERVQLLRSQLPTQ